MAMFRLIIIIGFSNMTQIFYRRVANWNINIGPGMWRRF